MTDVFTIPLATGAQKFQIQLGENLYSLSLIFRDSARGGAWFLDIARVDGSDSILGIPLVLGVDLLAQFKHKRFGTLTCTTAETRGRRPNYEDMGTNLNLYWSE